MQSCQPILAGPRTCLIVLSAYQLIGLFHKQSEVILKAKDPLSQEYPSITKLPMKTQV